MQHTYRIERTVPDARMYETVGQFGADRAVAVDHFKFYRSIGKRTRTDYRLVRDCPDGAVEVLA